MIIIGHTRDAQGQPTVVEGTAIGERRVYAEGPCMCESMRQAGYNIWSDCMGCTGVAMRYDHSTADIS